MKSGLSLLKIGFLIVILAFSLPLSTAAQERPALGRIAVLRMKNVNMTVEHKEMLKDFAAKLNAALGATKLFEVPAESAVVEALDDEGVDPDDLIELEDYLEVGKTLNAGLIVIGSVWQRVMTLSVHARVYSSTDGSLKLIINTEDSMDRLAGLIDLTAHRIAGAAENPAPLDSLYASFEWSHDFRISFGPERLDLAPPIVHYVHHNPPFEIAMKVNMDRLAGGFVVTNFDLYADGEPIAAVSPEMMPPLLLREEDVVINGHTFCFQANLKELRGSYGRAFLGALITIKARSCE